MTMDNHHTIALVVQQRHTELLARAAAHRLAAHVPRRPSPWRRLIAALTRDEAETAGDPRLTQRGEEPQLVVTGSGELRPQR